MPDCIILYDDQNSLVCPYGWDDDCDGAVACIIGKQAVAVFPDHKAARKAIAISTAWARLNKELGKPACEDFTDPMFRKFIRIVRLAAK